jgi:hypothetical protein
MPITGTRNELFGVFKSHCCGTQVVIASGAVFPKCPNHSEHPKIRTLWIPIEVWPDKWAEFSKEKSKEKPAA